MAHPEPDCDSPAPQPARRPLRGLAAAVEVALASALLILAAAKTASARQAHARLGPLLTEYRPAPGAPVVRDLSGLDGNGLPVGVHVGNAHDRFAVFMIHGATAADDAAYWDSVAAELRQRASPVRLVAFCDSEQCARSVQAKASFPVIAYAENVVLLRVRYFAQSAQVMEMNGKGLEIRQFRPDRQAPGVTAAELAK